jgi:hypothetical protein
MKRYALAISVLAIALGTPAHASLMVNIGGTVSGGTVTGGTVYFDNQAGVDQNPTIGIMDIGTFLDTVLINFVINGFTATSGSPTASLAMNSNANLEPTATLPRGLNIVISDTGFTNPLTPFTLSQTVNLLSSIGGIRATGTATGYYGDSNTDFDVNGPNTGEATASVIGGVGVNTPAVSALIGGPNPYSLTTAIHIDILARGSDPIQNLQINANLSTTGVPIPEPATMALIGLGLIGLAVGKRRRSA